MHTDNHGEQTLPLAQAQSLINTALSAARHRHLPPMAVVVLDARGCVKAAGSEDGVGTLRHDIAVAKANAALGMGMNTQQLSSLLQRGVLSQAFVAALVGQAQGKFNPNAGGMLIYRQGQVIGAMGASGASEQQDHDLLAEVLAEF